MVCVFLTNPGWYKSQRWPLLFKGTSWFLLFYPRAASFLPEDSNTKATTHTHTHTPATCIFQALNPLFIGSQTQVHRKARVETSSILLSSQPFQQTQTPLWSNWQNKISMLNRGLCVRELSIRNSESWLCWPKMSCCISTLHKLWKLCLDLKVLSSVCEVSHCL